MTATDLRHRPGRGHCNRRHGPRDDRGVFDKTLRGALAVGIFGMFHMALIPPIDSVLMKVANTPTYRTAQPSCCDARDLTPALLHPHRTDGNHSRLGSLPGSGLGRARRRPVLGVVGDGTVMGRAIPRRAGSPVKLAISGEIAPVHGENTPTPVFLRTGGSPAFVAARTPLTTPGQNSKTPRDMGF